MFSQGRLPRLNSKINMKKSEFIFSRHAKKAMPETPEEELSEKYFGITKEGEKEIRARARELADIVEKLPDKSIVILSGVSRAGRTRSTLEIYGSELRSIFKDREDIVIPQKQIEEKEERLRESLDDLKSISGMMKTEERRRKAIIQFPLWIKQFTASPKQWKEWSSYFSTAKRSGSEIARWIEEKKGPNPLKLAKDLLTGIKRVNNFFRKFFPENTIMFINVDHSGELDALFTYLANEGAVEKEGFEKIGGREVEGGEISQLSFLSNGEIEFKYRGATFSCPSGIFNPEDKISGKNTQND